MKVKPGYKIEKLRFGYTEEIPDDWNEKSLDFFLDVNMGQSPPSASYNFVEDGVPFIQGVSEFRTLNPEIAVWCTEPKKIAEKDEILFSVRAPVGKMNISTSKMCIGRGISALKPKKNAILMYCYYLLQQYIHRFIPFSQGIPYDAINKPKLSKTKFPFTENIDEQNQILYILSNVDDVIEITSQTIEQLQHLKHGMLEKLMTEGLNHSQLEQVKIGFLRKSIKLPNDWEVSPLNDLTDKEIGDGIHTTPEYVENSIFYFINGNNLDNGSIVFPQKTKTVSEDEYKKYRLNLSERTVLLSLNGTIGNLAFFKNEKIILGKSACYMNCNDKLDPTFLFYLFQSNLLKSYIISQQTQTSIPNLSLHSVRNTPIPHPKSITEQTQIALILSNVDSVIALTKSYKSKLEILKKGIISKLLTGELRVKI
jgi:type I restriction enzyme, S subunit